MILRFDEDGEFNNNRKVLKNLFDNFFPSLYLDILEKYVTNENSIFIKVEKDIWYSASVKSGEFYNGILFLGIEEMQKAISYCPNTILDGINVIPFASIGTNSYYCFDYRENKKEPEIIYFDPSLSKSKDEITEEDLNFYTEEEWMNLGVTKLFVNFKELLKNIVPDPDEIKMKSYTTIEDFDDLYDGWKDYFYDSKS